MFEYFEANPDVFWGAVAAVEFLILVCGRNDRKKQREELQRKQEDLKNERTRLDSFSATLDRRQSDINNLVRDRTIEMARNVANREYLKSTPAFAALYSDPSQLSNYSRLRSVLTKDIKIFSPFDVSATTLSNGHAYHTTLFSCSCPDFLHRRTPCKHMLRVALELGLVFNFDSKPIEEEVSSLLNKHHELETSCTALSEKEKRLTKDNRALENLLNSKLQSFPWLAELYTSYRTSVDLSAVSFLDNKKNPAHKTAAEIKKTINRELRKSRLAQKQAEYQLHFYESLFPWLQEFREVPPEQAFNYAKNEWGEASDDREMLRKWISPEEYSKLSNVEKYQLALDRYLQRHKDNWEVGIDYERYIGYLCEQHGYSVLYNGAISKKEDMGRDLILLKDDTAILIQCKRWKKEKTIHENHIFQLAGSVFEYAYNNPDKKVLGVFVTTTQFSPIASLCAEKLGILLFPQTPFEEFPRIKCNIGRNGEKIFHLPMDQQYDSVKISRAGELYALTVEDAFSLGFRRAYKWHGGKPKS